MERIRVVIVDDEPLARSRLRALLKHDPDIEIVAECVDGFEAIPVIQDEQPDLVFLDIQMPEKDGFGVVEEIGIERMPIVIFVTAYDQHALRAFQVHALDYLLKPFDEKRFGEALQRAKNQIRNARGSADGDLRNRLLSMMEDWKRQARYLERIMIKAGGRLSFLKTAELDWIKAEGNYVRLHAGGASYLLRETVNNFEAQLDPEKFLRIHRSTIVNIERVKEIQQMFHGEYRVILDDGTQLKLGRNYRKNLPRFAEKAS
jgi:two-component system LytT family response regulator